MSVCVRCRDFPAYEQEEADGTTDGKKYCAVCWENRHTIRANDRADRAEALLCESSRPAVRASTLARKGARSFGAQKAVNRADLEVIRRRCHRTQWFSPDAERDREALLDYVDRLLKVVDVADHLVGAVEDDARRCPCCDDDNDFLPCICTRAMVAPKALVIYHDARNALDAT